MSRAWPWHNHMGYHMTYMSYHVGYRMTYHVRYMRYHMSYASWPSWIVQRVKVGEPGLHHDVGAYVT